MVVGEPGHYGGVLFLEVIIDYFYGFHFWRWGCCYVYFWVVSVSSWRLLGSLMSISVQCLWCGGSE